MDIWSNIERIIREESQEHDVRPIHCDVDVLRPRYMKARQAFEMAEGIGDESRIKPYCDGVADLAIVLVGQFGRRPIFVTAVCERIVREIVCEEADSSVTHDPEFEPDRQLYELAAREQRAKLVDKLLDRVDAYLSSVV